MMDRMLADGNRMSRKKFYQLLWITVLMVAANNLCLFADSVICCRLCGSDTLVAIQMTSPVLSFVNFAYWMFGIGGSLICFEKITKNKKTEGDRIFTTAIIFAVVIGALVCLVCNLFSSHMISVLCSRAELQEDAMLYMRIFSFGYPFLSFVLSMGYFMRADGITNIPFIAIILTNAVNIMLDIILISVFNMGVAGAAFASVTGYISGTVVSCFYFADKRHTLKLRRSGRRCFANAADIMKRGFSSASTQIYYLFRSLFLNRWVSYLLPESLTAMTVFLNTLFIPYMIYIGLSQTMSPIVSLYHTEKDYGSIRYIFRKTTMLALIFTTILAVVIAIFPGIVTSLFNITEVKNAESLYSAFRILPFSYIAAGISFILLFYLQAIRKTKLSGILSLLDSLVFIVLFSLIFGLLTGADGIWISFIISPLAVILIYFAYTRKNCGNLLLLPTDETPTVKYELCGSAEEIRNRLGDIPVPEKICRITERIISDGIKYDMINISVYTDPGKKITRIRYFSDAPQTGTKDYASELYEKAAYSDVLGMHCISVMEKN